MRSPLSILVLLLELFFLFNLLSANGLISLKLNILALLFHVKVDHPIELLLIVLIVSSNQKTLSTSCGSGCTIHIIGLGLVVFPTSHATNRSDTYILIQEVLISEVIEEGGQVDHGAIFFIDSLIFIVNYVLLDLLDHSIGNSLKNSNHSLRYIALTSNVFLELLINLLSDPASPTDNLIIHKLNPLVQIFSLLALLSQYSHFVVEGLQLGADDCARASLFAGVVVVSDLHLKLVKLIAPVLILATKVINLALVIANCHKQLRVSLLSRQEFVHYLLHVGEASACTDLLESIFNFLSAFHLSLHLLLEELRPHLLYHEVFLHFKFV